MGNNLPIFKTARSFVIVRLLAIMCALASIVLASSCVSIEYGGDRTAQGHTGGSVDTTGMRDYYVDVDKAQSATVLVYMCGADLETYSAAASNDLYEIARAQLCDNVNVVVQTGGARQWHFADNIDPNTRLRWTVKNGAATPVGDAGQGSMLSVAAVTDFIEWGTSAYPADRYMLVFWDHGGGTIGGYGHDEMHPDDPALSLQDLRNAVSKSSVKFDMIGFDACLMGSIETAYALEPCADYLLASEEYELNDGWAWTNWLTQLSQDTTTPTTELGKTAIDEFSSFYYAKGQTDITLSLIDLREVANIYEKMGVFLQAAEQSISADNRRFNELSQARSYCRSFADGGADQVDLVDMIERTNFEGKDELKAAVDSCVKYRSASGLSGVNGIAMYFPYSEVKQYSGMRTILQDIGYVTPTEFYDYFLSIMGNSNGSANHGIVSHDQSQTVIDNPNSAGSANASANSYPDSTFSGQDWFQQLAGMFQYQTMPDKLDLVEQDGAFVVKMDQNMWDAFSSFKLTVMEEYQDGMLMLGTDNVYEVTDDGDISVIYTGELLTINGKLVSFFSDEPSQLSNGEYSYSAVVPALLNGQQEINIGIYWPPASQQGEKYTATVLGYRIADTGMNPYTYQRGWIPFKEGDTIKPEFDFYDKQGNYQQTLFGDEIKVENPDDLKATYEIFEHETSYFWGTLTTVYGDQIDTDVLEQ